MGAVGAIAAPPLSWERFTLSNSLRYLLLERVSEGDI